MWLVSNSLDDHIEGFVVGLLAIAGHRFTSSAGPTSHNLVELQLIGTTIRTARTDSFLQAASSEVPGLSAGDGNTLRVLVRAALGSGVRANAYAHASPEDFGVGTRVEILGSPGAFARSNENIIPAPPAEFFIGPW
jgi:hypothetical protein